MRYFIELRYDGTAYCGWQRQKSAPSVQQCIEQGLSTLLRCPTEIVGAGRTDTGVHASYYVAHFDAAQPIADTTSFAYHLNAILPRDIAVMSISPVADDAHARFDAVRREYRYHIENRKNPFSRAYAWQYYVSLDVEAMNEAAARLFDFEDFTSFAKLNSNNTTNICHIYEARWRVLDDGVLEFTIAADRFLRNMVRAIVGTLVDVGRGRYSVEEFRTIVEAKDLSKASAGAPAQGLFLSDVVYPKEIFQRETDSAKSGDNNPK